MGKALLSNPKALPASILKKLSKEQINKINKLNGKIIDYNKKFGIIEDKYGRVSDRNPDDKRLPKIADKGFEIEYKCMQIINELTKYMNDIRKSLKK